MFEPLPAAATVAAADETQAGQAAGTAGPFRVCDRRVNSQTPRDKKLNSFLLD